MVLGDADELKDYYNDGDFRPVGSPAEARMVWQTVKVQFAKLRALAKDDGSGIDPENSFDLVDRVEDLINELDILRSTLEDEGL